MGKHQFGSGNMPVFVGAKYQRGHGLGNILADCFAAYYYHLSKEMHRVGPVKR